jgi:transposase-like protein
LARRQRCTVHFLRDLRGHCCKDQHDALGALIRQLFTAPDGVEARRHLVARTKRGKVIARSRRSWRCLYLTKT